VSRELVKREEMMYTVHIITKYFQGEMKHEKATTGNFDDAYFGGLSECMPS